MATIGRTVTYYLGIDWNFNGSYTDETAYLVRASGDYRIAAPGSNILSARGIIPQMTLTLRNDGRFSPFNTSGALYSYLQNGKAYHAPVRLNVTIDGGSAVRVFTGYLKTPVENAVTSTAAPTITFDCRGVEEQIQHMRMSTTLADFASYYDNNLTEAEIITEWLTDAGMTPGAGEIDKGLFVIPTAWLDDESPLDDIWQLAAACGGWVYSSREGEILYKNATYLAQGVASSETIDEGDYEGLSLRYDDRELFSDVTVEASPRRRSDEAIIWEPEEVPVIPPDSTKTVTATFRQPAYSITSVSYDAVTHSGTDLSADADLTQTQYAQRVEMEFTNDNTDYAMALRNLQILGEPMIGEPSTEEKREGDNTSGFWNSAYNREQRSRRLRGNVYIQSRSQAAMLAEMLSDWHEMPTAYVIVTNAVGSPSRDLLDRITISNDSMLTSDLDVFITGIRWTASNSGFKQTIEGVAADVFYPYADAAEGYFVIGTNKLGATGGSLRGRLFY
jgi:hypothetical protein